MPTPQDFNYISHTHCFDDVDKSCRQCKPGQCCLCELEKTMLQRTKTRTKEEIVKEFDDLFQGWGDYFMKRETEEDVSPAEVKEWLKEALDEYAASYANAKFVQALPDEKKTYLDDEDGRPRYREMGFMDCHSEIIKRWNEAE